MRQQADKSTGSIETQSLLSELDHGLSGAMNHPMVPEAIASQPDVHSDERQIATVTRSQSDDDSAPEEESSRIGPENIVPEVSAKICNAFAATGRCKFGKKCRYQHVRPDNAKPVTNPGQERNTATSKRKTLFNRVGCTFTHIPTRTKADCAIRWWNKKTLKVTLSLYKQSSI